MIKVKSILADYFENNFNLPCEKIENIVSAFKPLNIERENHFLKKGKISNSVCFIVEGVMRSHRFDEAGNDITNFFFKENQFLTNLESYRTDTSSQVNIQAVTDCKLLVLEKQQANQLPKWTEIFPKLVEQALLRKIAEQRSLCDLRAIEKYELFLETQVDILQRVPLKYIASYLGIAPQSLSRIRRSV